MEPSTEKNNPNQQPDQTEKQIRRRTFISFFSFFALNGIAYGGWRWLYKKAPEETAGITAGAKKPLRRTLNKTELAFRKIFSPNHLVKTYPKSKAAKEVRANGDIGLSEKTASDWKLNVIKKPGEILQLSLADLKALPKTEIVFDFKCVEGWDQIQHWAGVKMLDFMAHYQLKDQAEMQYAGLVTPDQEYYVGIDMPSFLHPQTILCYEMNDAPLKPEHGAPLRLIIPVKYGIKNLKNIGTISFANSRPPDYWAELGYDYYSGL